MSESHADPRSKPPSSEVGPVSALAGVLDVTGALELRRSLLALSGRSPTVRLDFSAVTEIDAAALQLLVALERRTAQSAGSFHVTHACDSIAAVLTRAGCAHWLA